MKEISNQCTDFKFFCLFVCLLSKSYIWVDRTDLFKIIKLVYGARVIVTILYGNLQKQSFYGRYSELAGWLSVSVKVENLGNFLEQLTPKTLTASDILNLLEGSLY